jgi:membrane-bound lytic murein transglycosylase B
MRHAQPACALMITATLAATFTVSSAQKEASVEPAQTRQETTTPAAPPAFSEWLQGLLAEARKRGYSEQVLAEALGDIEPAEHIIQSDRSQAELTPGFDRYFKARVTPKLVRQGRQLGAQHRMLLRQVAERYGVQPRIVLAVWGMESRYGRAMGRVPVFQALVTLAWEPRRSDFFRGELFDALSIVANGDITANRMKGSWAGAMGQTQFMPSSYLKHAVDFDGDGRRDIWSSTADALASIANYLQSYGWHPDATWGREVRVTDEIGAQIDSTVPMRTAGCSAARNMTVRIPLKEWRKLGVRRVDGGPLPNSDLPASLVRTDARDFLVYQNYDALLGYNCAHYYALTVGLLADRLR